MARVMTLDGLDQAHVSAIRARLDGVGRSWWQQPVGLAGLLDPITTYPLWILGGLVGGLLVGGVLTKSRR